MLKIKRLLTFKLSNDVFIMLINVKMSTFGVILTSISMINFVPSRVDMSMKKFYHLGTCCDREAV